MAPKAAAPAKSAAPAKDKAAEPAKDKAGAEGEKKDGAEGEKKEGEGAAPASGAEAAPSSSAKDANGKCVGEDKCPAPPVNFSAPKEGLAGMKKKLDDSVKNAGKNIVTAITNPAKCAAIAVGAVPSMIDGVFKSISGGLDGVAKSFGGVTKAASDKGFTGILAPFKIWHSMFITKIYNAIQGITLEPGFLDKPEFKGMSIEQVADKVVEKAGFKSKVFKKAIETAEFRGIFKPWFQQYIDSLLNVLKIAQPEVDRINAEVKAIIEGMGTNVGDSVGHAITNVIVSVLGALPVVGGIASAINSADQLGTAITDACGPPIAKGAGIIIPIIKGFNKQKSRLECEVDKLSHKLEPLLKSSQAGGTMQSGTMQSGTMQSGTMQSDTMQSGGKNIKKNIQKTTKRINYLLKRFTCRPNHKTNYTRRLQNRRC